MKKNNNPKESKAKLSEVNERENIQQDFNTLSYEEKLKYWDENKLFFWGEWHYKFENNVVISIRPDDASQYELKLFTDYIINKCRERNFTKTAEYLIGYFKHKVSTSPIREEVIDSEFQFIERRKKENESVKEGYIHRAAKGLTFDKVESMHLLLLYRGPFDNISFVDYWEGYELAEFAGWLNQYKKNPDLLDKQLKPVPVKNLKWNAPINILGDILFQLKKELKNPETNKGLLEGDDSLIAEMICNYFTDIDSSQTIIDCLNKSKRIATTPRKFRVELKAIEDKSK